MLSVTNYGERGPLVVMLHWLGGSARTWTEVCEGLAARGMRCAAVDLPGFGAAAGDSKYSISDCVHEVITAIQALRVDRDGPWFLTGHSMGGKLATIVARAHADRMAGLDGLRGLILVSPSPPGLEPMKESKREEMLATLGTEERGTEVRRKDAESFVDDNVGRLPLLDAVRTRAVEDVLRADPLAFHAWLTKGSKEDWGERVGLLRLPVLVLAGSEEPQLGPEAQLQHTAPHFSDVTVMALQGAGHLSPIERPIELVERISAFVKGVGVRSELRPSRLSDAFRELIESGRTSEQTRAVMMKRLREDESEDGPEMLPETEVFTLRAMAARIVPGCPFDLASAALRWLTLPLHDGWRHDGLPEDAEAWRLGLQSLDAAALREFGVPFVALDADRQDGMLRMASEGELGKGLLGSLHIGGTSQMFSGKQMSEWLGDVCGELTRMYLADPRTMERIGFTGFADEGGFTQIRLGEREEFER